jgi:membrane-bound ClpP family serine protease
MTTGASLFLIALGAVLKFAVTASVSGVALGTVGVILMVVGALGLALSLLWLGRRDDGVVVAHRPAVVERDPLV